MSSPSTAPLPYNSAAIPSTQPIPQPTTPYTHSENDCPCPCTTLQCGSRIIACLDGTWCIIHLIVCFWILYIFALDGREVTYFAMLQTVAVFIHLILSIILYIGATQFSTLKCCSYLCGTVIQLIIEFIVAVGEGVKLRIAYLLISLEVILVAYIIFLIYAVTVVSFFIQEMKSNKVHKRVVNQY